jgi:outer membrane protein TolC
MEIKSDRPWMVNNTWSQAALQKVYLVEAASCVEERRISRRWNVGLKPWIRPELMRKSSLAERYPSIEQVADYGITGVNPASTHGTVDAAVTLRVPIFQGGKVHGDVLRADASLERAKQVLEDLRAQIDEEVRDAYLDLEAAAQEVSVEKSAVTLATETLEQSRDRFSSGVTDNIEVVQAQDALATANDAYIASLYSYNVAKISLARAIGVAESRFAEYLKGE